MSPPWTSSDLLPLVCSHLTAVQDLAALSQVNKAINNYLFSITGGKHWVHAGKLMCGEEYWPANLTERTDPRYLTMINMCPWVSKPTKTWIPYKQAKLARKKSYPMPDYEQLTIYQLRESKCIPESEHLKIGRAFKVHNGVLMVLTYTSYLGGYLLYGQPYFVSSKDFKLLRDMSYIKQFTYAVWSISPGNLKAIDSSKNILWQFGPRNNKAFIPRGLCARTEQACWCAYRGDIDTALNQLQGVDPSSISCRGNDLCWHVIESGSISALQKLIHAIPKIANNKSFTEAIQKDDERMANLILSSSTDKDECIGYQAITNLLETSWYSLDMLRTFKNSKAKVTSDGRTAVELLKERLEQGEHGKRYLLEIFFQDHTEDI